ncbi:MAG: HAD family phosphatase [Lachnospiraceae bacterium]|nr:HAD family phosphatase [Lachnospiraceae bacterium]
MIKLIMTDIDGTLVKDGSRNLPTAYVETIGELLDRGIHFVAASGRSRISTERLFEPLKERIYYATCNGTLMGNSRELLFAESLDRKLLNEILADVRTIKDTVPFLTGAGVMYADSEEEELIRWLTEGYQEDVTRVADMSAMPEDFVKLSVYDKKHRSGETFRSFCEKWKGMVSTSTAGAMWLDIYKLGVNKGTAVRWYQKFFGVTPEETLTFGDQQNDVEMLKASYHSYAVGNAIAEVKETARYLADTCENEGVLKVLRSLLEESGRGQDFS